LKCNSSEGVETNTFELKKKSNKPKIKSRKKIKEKPLRLGLPKLPVLKLSTFSTSVTHRSINTFV
jgi:hypothetical protein